MVSALFFKANGVSRRLQRPKWISAGILHECDLGGGEIQSWVEFILEAEVYNATLAQTSIMGVSF